MGSGAVELADLFYWRSVVRDDRIWVASVDMFIVLY